MPDGDGRPLHLAVRKVHEVDTGRAANGSDPVAAQKGHTRRRSRFRCIVGGERAECVVWDSLAHRGLAGNALRHVHAMVQAKRAQSGVICHRPTCESAVGAAAMVAQRTQEVVETGSLRTILRQAAQVHAVPAAGGERDGKLVRRSCRLQALQTNAAAFILSASRVG